MNIQETEREYMFVNVEDVIERQEFFSDVKDAIHMARMLEESSMKKLRVFCEIPTNEDLE